MVLGPQGPGRVGRREATVKRPDPLRIGSFFVLLEGQDRTRFGEKQILQEILAVDLTICLGLFPRIHGEEPNLW